MSGTALPALPCLCASLRRAARALTQRYEESMAAAGLTSSQFTILQALSLAGDVTQGRLGQMLAMDSTTLTRTLGIMRRKGWISARAGDDRRERWLRPTNAGRAKFEAAEPLWHKAQAATRAQLGKKRWKDLMDNVNHVTAMVTEEERHT